LGLAIDDDPVPPEVAEDMIVAALGPEEVNELIKMGEVDLCYQVDGLGRFRTNIYRQLQGFDAVFRLIPPKPPTLKDLGLPSDLGGLTEFHQGMVLVTGPKGCGKSSTLAALVDLINGEREEHILTVEDPVEYVHPSKKCLVNQRDVGKHTKSFARALRGALREDPDIIVIGELRDLETISLAMTAAETGHFVLGTLHTNNAIRTINRIVGAFPSKEQDQVRSMLSESLRAVISQRLLPGVHVDQVVAIEILKVTKAAANIIRENKIIQLKSTMQTGTSLGMCIMDDALERMLDDDEITAEVAYEQAEEKARFAGRLADR